MGIHLRIYKDSPNSTEFQGMNRTPFFDPKKGVPYQSNHRNQQPTIGIGRIGLMADSLKSQDSLSVYCMVYLYAKGCHPGGGGWYAVVGWRRRREGDITPHGCAGLRVCCTYGGYR